MPTPPEPEQPRPGPVLEPVRVLRPRRFDALAELMREMHPDPGPPEPGPPRPGPREPGADRPGPREPGADRRVPRTALPHGPVASRHGAYESFGPASGAPPAAEDDTQELPPVPAAPRAGGPGPGARRAGVALAVAAAALVGFGCALLLPARQDATAAPRPSRSAAPAPADPAPADPAPADPAPADPAGTASSDPDGPGTLRQGDTGPEVTELQQRLLRVPDVYRDGSTSGTYDAPLTEAVARFQLWYGISGDETGVYGDDTRRALESRTAPGAGG
ncbi:peptidoglycan-binding protein [Streptomyces sp. NPDC004596]